MHFIEYFLLTLRLAFTGLALTVLSVGANAAELIVVESNDCPYCERFHAEIAIAYPNTDEGKLAPLHILQLGEAMPTQYSDVKPARVTPTFILVEGNKEIDRLEGYPGDNYFWFLLGEMLAKLDLSKLDIN